MALFFYKEKNKDIRAAAYLRLSIEDGDKAESNSIGNQRELIRDFAAERPGLHLVEEYADDGYTGTNFERPGFKRMMEDIKSGKINCIIVKDLSRLGRNYIEMGKYLEQIFPMMGIRFIAINDNYDNANTESSDSDSIVVPFKNLLNDSYCRDISIKVRSQLDMKRRKGEFIGGYAIYGYCKDKRNKNRLVVDEYAADIVRSIYRRKLEGMSAQAIAEQLNSENVLAPSEYKRLCGLNYHSGFKAGTHAKWQAIQVLRILKNEVYTGTMVQGRRQKINYKIKKIRDVEESGWIRVPNMHEAIIPQKLFDTVQEVLKLDTCASKGQQAVNLFSGIVRCGGCGQNMVRRTVSKNGKKYIYLHCVTNHNGLGCSSHLISESKLAEVVLAALQGKVQQISGLEHRLDEINEIPKNERRLKSVEEHLKMLEQEEQKYQTLRRQLYEDMSSGIVSKEEYKEFSHAKRKNLLMGSNPIIAPDSEMLWNAAIVWRILRRYEYTGALVMGRRKKIDVNTTSVRTLPEDKWIIAENAHAAIVTKDEYYQAQKAIRNVTPIQYKVGDDFALKGKICCGNCNRQLRHERQYGEMVFYCGYKRSAGKFSKCYGGYYREYSVNAKVARAIKTVFYALDVVNQGMQEKQSITVRCVDIEDLEKQAEVIRVEQIKLYELYADGVLLRDAYIEKKKALSEKLAVLQDSIRTEKEEQECADELDEEIRALTKQASEKTYIGGLTKDCVDAFVSMVYLYDDQTMKIEFNCEDVIRRALEKYGA